MLKAPKRSLREKASSGKDKVFNSTGKIFKLAVGVALVGATLGLIRRN